MADPQAHAELIQIKASLRKNPIRVAISTRALFDLEAEHRLFVDQGTQAYVRMQRELEAVLIGKGPAYDVVERLLALNEPDQPPYVEVILLSRNAPDVSLRAFNSIEAYGLAIRTGSFTSGRPVAAYLEAWDIDLLLSNEASDVHAAAAAGTAAAKLGVIPSECRSHVGEEVRIALDGDAVTFGAESDLIYKRHGLKAFLKHEVENATKPMATGPFGAFLKKLSLLKRAHAQDGVSKVRIAIVTARSAPAHTRVIHTLRHWQVEADEAHFVAGGDKAKVLAAYGAHIFFDDQEKHVVSASRVVPSGLVPGPHDADDPVIPTG